MDHAHEILALAHEAGFDLAGLAPLAPPRDAHRFEQWLDAGRNAGMAWMERYRERIVDPRGIDRDARTLLVVGMSHARDAVVLPGGGRVARYAAGRDYHNLMTRRLRKLARRLDEAGLAGSRRSIVDAGPLLERSHAAEAGLGFSSKSANLLNPKLGPWFFLGELLLDVELDTPNPGRETRSARVLTGAPAPVPPRSPDTSIGTCGTCTACLDACPTGALPAPGVLDANRCISYHTIENRAAIPHELRALIGDWAFGCDICSEVCPFGRSAPDTSARFGTHAFVAEHTLVDWLTLPADRATAGLRGSPLQRPKLPGLARNAAIVLGNNPNDEGREALVRALNQNDEAVVRATAFWALVEGHLNDDGVRGELDRALVREPDAEARRDMAVSRGA